MWAAQKSWRIALQDVESISRISREFEKKLRLFR
jgi:hypothetical protein